MSYIFKEEVPVYSLFLNELQMELLHNLLSSGPRLGHSTFREVAGDLLDAFVAVRGELDYEDRLFNIVGEDFDADELGGLEWHREEPN
jgi:hypothetical protein